ncbi:MAG TPA: Trp family transcriptional regulator [Candidatus Saccharibacteria bacterium]|nr:Trp family transcriptional regulator [Candidatus Saccharibacteria bacterium]
MNNFDEFITTVNQIQDKSLLEDFLRGITTANERKELSQRLEIIKRLLDGQPQHKIAEELGVGVATVTRGSKELSEGRFKALRNNDA